MGWTALHGPLLSQALKNVLGTPQAGAMAFVRCLNPDAIEALSADASFRPDGWQVLRVTDEIRNDKRTITADRAVERREAKMDATLLLVDTERAGAGMDGIYSAAREVNEPVLFREAQRLAANEITRQHSAARRRYAERAVKTGRGYGGAQGVSPWAEFEFLCHAASGNKTPGAYLYLLGLWPVLDSEDGDPNDLKTSRMFVVRLLSAAVSNLAPAARIEALRLDRSSERKIGELERFLHDVDAKPLLTGLERLAEREHLWVGELQIERPAESIQGIELTSWRNRNGAIAKWSGLIEEQEEDKLPALILSPDTDSGGRDATLEVRWKTDPTNLEKNAAQYRVSVRTDMDEDIAVQEIAHAARKGGEKCRFSNNDFSLLDDDAVLSAKVVIEVVGDERIEAQESEEIQIRFGDPPIQDTGSGGIKVRTFSDGLVELGKREAVTTVASSPVTTVDSKGFVLRRTRVEQGKTKSFRVFQPSLIADVERQWIDSQGTIGRWTVKVRGTGSRAEAPKFEPFDHHEGHAWKQALSAHRKMAERFRAGGGVAQIYDEAAGNFGVVRDYLRAWDTLLKEGDPWPSLAHTVEVQSLSGRTIGLIVLPAHPLRVAWHVAYDNLVFDTCFRQEQRPHDIRNEFSGLDGAMYPAFLPNPSGGTFVFADTLGFYAVGMVPDSDKEPKAAISILERALGDGETADTAPTTGRQSANVLRNEIVKYLDCHTTEDDVRQSAYAARFLHIHALRAGDGLTVARSLGGVHEHYQQDEEAGDEVGDEEQTAAKPVFSLELYPSEGQRGIVGRFIAEAREKRRSGAGVLAPEDRWMLESLSLPGGVNMPRLRWSRKERQDPKTAAHMAIAFDSFESRVGVSDMDEERTDGSFHAFGLLSFFQRRYSSQPSPVWLSTVPVGVNGEKHPSRRTHTETLMGLQIAIQSTVARHLGARTGVPELKTELSSEKAESLRNLHKICDWVVTLDRNAGIEYFDSPMDNPEIYDAYVIDCVPEREDLGCLQLITSTANLDEVRNLLDGALDLMGLSHSRRNAEFLLGHLKALSGRLAIRLTGHRPATSELIALAVAHAHCQSSVVDDECWVSLEDGFIVPVDDVRDLLPPLRASQDDDGKASRPDLIYVTAAPRKGLAFQFVEVKYRRHLRGARSLDLLKQIQRQTSDLRERWDRWYSHEDVCSAFRAIRRAKLARVLHFYADKAQRHHLPAERHGELVSEIDRMIERGGDYALATLTKGDRGWVFCPEYAGRSPLEITPDRWDTRVFLFGPSFLPDGDFGSEESPPTSLNRQAAVKGVQSKGWREGTRSIARSLPADGDVNADASEAGGRETERGEPSVCLGTDTLTNADVQWPLSVKGNPHLLVAGLPGMGKTNCLVNLCRQLVAAKIRPIVFSYHQDIDERLEESVGTVRFIDFAGLGFNPLRVIDRDSRMAHLDVAGAMRDIFGAIYPGLGDIQGDRIRKAIKKSFEETGWGSGVVALEPPFRRFVEILRNAPKPDRELGSLLARLGELDDYGFFSDDVEIGSSLWEGGLPTVIRIHTTQNDNLQRAFACLVFYGLYKDMFRRGIQKHVTHALIFDEAHRAARLKLIPTMAKECRKYGISFVLASQEARDFDTSVFSAIANYLVLRCTDADAKFLVRNVSNSRQERALIDKIKQLDRFKAIYFVEGKSKPLHVALSP